MNIVFFGTSNVALPILEALNTNHHIAGVVTAPDAPVGRKQNMEESPVSALATDLKLTLFKPQTIKNNNLFRMELENLKADIFVVVSYGKILPMDIINLPPFKTVNVHFSLLPQYRGSSPIQHALMNGDTQTGTSIFILDEQVDHGPLLVQEKAAIDPDDNFFTLSDKLARLSAQLIIPTLEQYQKGELTGVPQNHTEATPAPIITKEDGKIDWTKTAGEIYNRFRAFYLWPGIWTTWNGKKLKIIDCVPQAGQASGQPGSVLPDGSIACGGGTLLKISVVQMEGKKSTGIEDFLRGYQNFPGSRLL